MWVFSVCFPCKPFHIYYIISSTLDDQNACYLKEESKTETSWFEEVPLQVRNNEPSAVASSAAAKTKQVSKAVSKLLR